ncbi:hypothetical protein IFR05_009588 [Cadophora sp. M221]|nr:hypothetical protein IFR05_009588 [Cadophora sp. M221]
MPQGTQEENRGLLALIDTQINDPLKHKYCPYLSAFDHECCGCKGKPGQENFFPKWEENMVKHGGWIERTIALQRVYEGKLFIEQGAYVCLSQQQIQRNIC